MNNIFYRLFAATFISLVPFNLSLAHSDSSYSLRMSAKDGGMSGYSMDQHPNLWRYWDQNGDWYDMELMNFRYDERSNYYAGPVKDSSKRDNIGKWLSAAQPYPNQSPDYYPKYQNDYSPFFGNNDPNFYISIYDLNRILSCEPENNLNQSNDRQNNVRASLITQPVYFVIIGQPTQTSPTSLNYSQSNNTPYSMYSPSAWGPFYPN